MVQFVQLAAASDLGYNFGCRCGHSLHL